MDERSVHTTHESPCTGRIRVRDLLRVVNQLRSMEEEAEAGFGRQS